VSGELARLVGVSADTLRHTSASACCRDRGGAPCRKVRDLAASKLTQLDGRIAEMEKLRTQLRALLHEWDDRLARTPEGEPARLLESLQEERTR
jgi:DNA-binding transcriptional MerR regulator